MGVPSTFVRASGCNLRCVWCDTPYASWDPEGPEMRVEEIATKVAAFGAKHVVITGGEPLIMSDIQSLCDVLKSAGHHITVETAATVYKDLKLDKKTITKQDDIAVSVTVTNSGSRAGKEVVQLYLTDLVASLTPAGKRLKRFAKIQLEPGQSRTLTFHLRQEDLAFIDTNNKSVVEPGEFEIMAGPNSVALKSTTLTITD